VRKIVIATVIETATRKVGGEIVAVERAVVNDAAAGSPN
jgi:hypothetical protein